MFCGGGGRSAIRPRVSSSQADFLALGTRSVDFSAEKSYFRRSNPTRKVQQCTFLASANKNGPTKSRTHFYTRGHYWIIFEPISENIPKKGTTDGRGFAKHYIWEQDSQNLGCVPRAGRVWEGMPADFWRGLFCKMRFYFYYSLFEVTRNYFFKIW